MILYTIFTDIGLWSTYPQPKHSVDTSFMYMFSTSQAQWSIILIIHPIHFHSLMAFFSIEPYLYKSLRHKKNVCTDMPLYGYVIIFILRLLNRYSKEIANNKATINIHHGTLIKKHCYVLIKALYDLISSILKKYV